MRKLCSLLLALPLVFAACADKADETRLPVREASITLTSEEVMEFDYKGGRSAIIFTYVSYYDPNIPEDKRPCVEPAPFKVECDADWIEIEDETFANVIPFVVKTNSAEEAREATIRVGFSELYIEVTITQAACLEVIFEAAVIEGEYREFGGDAPAKYFVVLSDNGLKEDGGVKANSTYYSIDIYVHNFVGQQDGYVTITPGEYTLDKLNTFASRTFSQLYSFITRVGESENNYYSQRYEEASAVVTDKGITLRAMIEGKEHIVTYNGEPKLKCGD